MADVEKTTKLDTINAEFEHVMELFLKTKTGVRVNTDLLGKSFEILLYQACTLHLPDVLEGLLEHLDAVPLLCNHYHAFEEEYHSSLLYDCLVIALENNHQTVIDILLKCVVEKHTDTTSETNRKSSKGRFMTLHCAAANGDVEIVKMLIEAGIDVNQKNRDGETALHVASDAATAEILLNNGANVMNRNKESPLYYRLGVIQKLMEKGTKPNTPSMELNNACESGVDTNIASALMQFSVDRHEMNQCKNNCVYQAINNIKEGELTEIYPLCANSKRENQAMIEKIRESHFGSEQRRINEIPKLHYEILALQNEEETGLDDMQPIKTILSKTGTNVNAVNKFGTTALYLAVERDLFDVATLLLDSGADPNVPTFGKYPLIVACRFLSHDFVKLLLERGADPNIFDCYLNSPLFIAAESYDFTLAKMLVEHGADVNRKDGQGRTILHSIVENSFQRLYHCSGVGCVDTVKYLLDNGFNVNQTNAKGKTVIADVIAKFTDYYLRGRFSPISILYQLFDLFLERGADVNLADSKGNNAMTAATKGESAYALQELLRHGGDPKYVRASGKSLIGISCIKSDPRSVRLLLDAGANINTITFKWLYRATKSYNTEVIDLLLNSGVKINTSKNDGTENMEIPTLGEFFTPFCRGTECILELFKAETRLQVLANCTRYRRKKLELHPIQFKCPLAGLFCKAIVLAGYKVKLQLIDRINGSEDQGLVSWLETDSMTPPTLSRLCRTVIRRQLSAASGYRTILPLIDVLEITNQLKMYLRFEGPFSEVDLTVCDEKTCCELCRSSFMRFYYCRLASAFHLNTDSSDEDISDEDI